MSAGVTVGHVLHAVIGPKSVVAKFASRWHRAHLINLPQEFAMVPLTPDLHDDIAELVGLGRPDPFQGFERLSVGIDAAIKDVSKHGRIGYIETDYFGGCGSQRAVVWERGLVLSGPFQTETTWDGSRTVAKPGGEWAINRILSSLGVWTRGAMDEFDMLGLEGFRSTESAANKDA